MGHTKPPRPRSVDEFVLANLPAPFWVLLIRSPDQLAWYQPIRRSLKRLCKAGRIHVDSSTAPQTWNVTVTDGGGSLGDPNLFSVGDSVRKTSGYQFPGVIVAVFRTTAGKWRVVVECTVPDVAGMLHIYAPGQIERIDNDH